MYNRKRNKIIAAIVAALLVVAMIVPMFAAALS